MTKGEFVAAYLDFPEACFTPRQLCPKAYFELVAVNHEQESMSLRRSLGFLSLRVLTLPCLGGSHWFTNEARDWGFAQFLPLEDTQHATTGFVVNDTLTLTVNITMQRETHLDKLTRSQTGFVGLKDEEDNSYMNSLLQCLYHIRRFRRVRIW